MRKYKFFYAILSLSILLIGILFYYFFREPTILGGWLGIKNNHIISNYLVYLDSLPSFVHVFSFSILTWLVLEQTYANSSILFWVVINMVFEFGQMVNSEVMWLPKFLQNYFQRGVYSHWDVVAIIFGGICAKIVMNLKTSYK